MILLKSTISLCGGVARKFTLVIIPIIPILGHGSQWFPIFSMVKKIFFAKGAMADLARGKYATGEIAIYLSPAFSNLKKDHMVFCQCLGTKKSMDIDFSEKLTKIVP